jgi:hypothetical protein
MSTQRKRILVALVVAMSACGAAVAAMPFAESLEPSGIAELKLPHLSVAGFAPGQFAFFPAVVKNRWRNQEILVLRDYDGTFNVFELPTDPQTGRVFMPDLTWWHSDAGTCQDFGPDVLQGKLKPSGVIRCHDDDKAAWGQEWRWTYKGKNLGSQQDDFPIPKFILKDDEIVIGKAGSRR